MMNHEHLFKMTEGALRRGQVENAIAYLTQILGDDPDSARAHAVLALALIRRKRIFAAKIEAHRSLELEPEAYFPHIAVASVEIAARHFATAEKHLKIAVSLEPDFGQAHEKLAALYFIWDRQKEAKEEIEIACALDPDDLDCLTTKARFLFSNGDRKTSESIVREILEINPEHLDALVLLGNIFLANGNIDNARENAIWALQLDSDDESALELLVSIKARESIFLGIWWRFQTFMLSGSSTRSVVLLIGMFLLYRVSGILLAAHNLTSLETVVSGIWLAFCVYTWVAPNIFKRNLLNELKQVELKSNF